MTDTVLKALILTFLAITAIGFTIFAVFFIIHKVFFKKQWKLMSEYNKISSDMFGISFFKIEVLYNNQLIGEQKFSDIRVLHDEINTNLKIIYENLVVLAKEIDTMNLKPANDHIKRIQEQLKTTNENFLAFEKEYKKYTAYPDEIQNIFQTFFDVFEALNDFYTTKVVYHQDFKKINALFDNISRTIRVIPEFSKHFNYKKTIDTLVDLRKKFEALINILFVVLRFQVVDIYLKTSMLNNKKILQENYASIASSDLPTLQKSLNIYKTCHQAFLKSYKNLDLKNAHRQIILATKALTNINQFCFVHAQTKDLINVSLQDIKQQTDQILNNKEHILASIEAISKYFVKDKKIDSWFKTITKDINEIDKLVSKSQTIDYKTHSQKINALKAFATISNDIVIKKEEINDYITKVNFALNQVISTINDLNDLYIYFCQMLAIAKNILPDNEATKILTKSINDNINLINDLTKQIIISDKPDFAYIASSTVDLVNNVNQVYNSINNEMVLKSYASKLMIYANRYRTIKENADDFKAIDKVYKAKQYANTIDQLLKLIKANK